jgi:hypothetical protein
MPGIRSKLNLTCDQMVIPFGQHKQDISILGTVSIADGPVLRGLIGEILKAWVNPAHKPCRLSRQIPRSEKRRRLRQHATGCRQQSRQFRREIGTTNRWT